MLMGQRHYARELNAYQQVVEDGKRVYRARTAWWSEVDAKIAAIDKLIASGDETKKAKANKQVHTFLTTYTFDIDVDTRKYRDLYELDLETYSNHDDPALGADEDPNELDLEVLLTAATA
jgi:hypothetical protein